MDITALFNALQGTLAPNNAIRKLAEEHLVAARPIPGFLTALLQVMTQPGIDEGVALAAAIQFKNSVCQGWIQREGYDRIWTEDQKAPVREILIEAAMHTKSIPVIIALGLPIAVIVNEDFPDRWPNLIPSLQSNLISGDPHRISNICFVIRYIALKMHTKENEGRIPFDMIINAVYPQMFEMLKVIVHMNTPEAAIVLRNILKAFYCASMITLGKSLNKPEVLAMWLEQLHIILQKPLPEPGMGEPAGQPADLEERPNWIWWKVKKWTMTVVNVLFYRYGIPKYVPAEDQELAKAISGRFIPVLMPVIMTTLAQYASNALYVTPRYASQLLRFASHCLESATTYKLLKPHIHDFWWKVILPVLSFNNVDHKRWVEDPEEFIRLLNDAKNTITDPRIAATEFIIDMMRLRPKPHKKEFWDQLMLKLQQWESAPAESRNPAEMDGLLFMFGATYDTYIKSKKHRRLLESVIAKFVVPYLASPVPFLRLRACWTFSQFGDMDFVNVDNFRAGAHGIMNCLEDAEMPVKFVAAGALRFLIPNNASHEVFAPHLAKLLDRFFAMMSELGVDDTVSTLDALIDKFKAELTSVAVPMCSKLTETFLQYVKDGDEDDDELALASSNCLGAICTILNGVQDRPDIYASLEPLLCPLVERLLSPEGDMLEFFEDAVSILDYFALHAPLSPRLWSLWVQLMIAFDRFAFDYVQEIMLSISAFVSRGTDTFLSGFPDRGLDLMAMLWSAHKKIEDTGSEADCVSGMSIPWIIIHYCGGRVDPFCVMIVKHFLERMKVAVRPEYRTALIAMIFKAIIYNPVLTIGVLEEMGATAWFVRYTEENLKYFKLFLHMETCSIAISHLLRIPPTTLPASIMPLVPTLMRCELKFLEGTCGGDGEEDDDGEASDGAEGDDDDEEVAVGDDEDAEDPEDDAYFEELMKLKEKARLAREGNLTSAIAGGEINDADWDDDFQAKYYGRHFQLPSYDVSPFVYFHDTMEALTAAYPQMVSNLNDTLDEEFRELLKDALESGSNLKKEGGPTTLTVTPL